MEIRKALDRASSAYAEKTVLRATVQCIPSVGGALDTLLSDKGSKIQKERIEFFLADLDERLKKFEDLTDLEPTEELFDLFTHVLDGVVRTRSSLKQKCFASIISKQVAFHGNWEEAETYTRFLKDLEEMHIRVLLFSISAPVCSSPFDRLKVVKISDQPNNHPLQPTSLIQEFSSYSKETLRMICSELTSKSLLYDVGIGRTNIRAMEYFIATDLAKWFINWVIE